jgi:hydrogenase maturation protein HypF
MTKHIVVKGVTQRVGFRPFVYGLATRLNLYGWVRNTSNGVEIVVQGSDRKY